MRKEKTKSPILYEKYKRDNNLNGVADAIQEEKASHKLKSTINHFVTMIILIVMIFLSAIGVIAICNSEMRMILLNMIRM